jgi:hypothetical protein
VSNGIVLTILVANYDESPKALAYILGLIPAIAAGLAAILATIGELYYSQRIAKLSNSIRFSQVKDGAFD